MTKLEQAAQEHALKLWSDEKSSPVCQYREDVEEIFQAGATWLREQVAQRLNNEIDFLQNMDKSPFFSDNKIAHEINSIKREILKKILVKITSICKGELDD